MAKLIVSNIVSLDGYVAGPGGNPAVLPMDHAFDAYNLERLREAGTLVLGRTTFEMFRGFWPALQHAPDAPPVLREISRLNTAMPKIVVSDSLAVEPLVRPGATPRCCAATPQPRRSPGSRRRASATCWCSAAARCGTASWRRTWSMNCT